MLSKEELELNSEENLEGTMKHTRYLAQLINKACKDIINEVDNTEIGYITIYDLLDIIDDIFTIEENLDELRDAKDYLIQLENKYDVLKLTRQL